MFSEANTKLGHTLSVIDHLPDWAGEFLKAKKIEGISSHTLRIYRTQIKHFLTYAEAQLLEQVTQIKPNDIRDFLLWLEDTGHNPGGIHVAYRVLKTFLRWYDLEAEPEGWRNPIAKVKAPKLAEEPLEPVELSTVRVMVDTCETDFLGKRDKAILLALLDTGLRARELLSLTLEDVNLITGAVMLRKGKGRKPRTVFLGRDTRKAVKAYLRQRKDTLPVLWVTENGTKALAYGGLRKMLMRRAEMAKVETPTAHDFRRAFAITMLRNGTDLLTLARLMGHTDLKVLKRYLRQLPDDLQEAHNQAGPVDHALA